MTLLSPGIETKEINLSATIGAASTGRGAMVGKFQWGPAYQITQVTSETALQSIFGPSNDYTFASYMTANNFLRYANDLRIVRIVDEATAKNASPLKNALNYTVNASAHSGYSVGDVVDVEYSGTVVTVNNKGRVTETGPNGTITKVYIPSGEVIAHMQANGQTTLTGYTVDFPSSSGSGANITLSLSTDSAIYFANEFYAPDAFSNSSTDSFKNLCSKIGLPTIASKYPGAYGDQIKVYVANKADYDASITPSLGNTVLGNVALEVFPTGGSETLNFKSYFQYGPANSSQYAVIVRVGDRVAESFIVSTKEGDKNFNGETLFINDFFDGGGSQYIYATVDNWKTDSGCYVLGGGIDTQAQADDWYKGWDLLSDPETLYTNLLIAGNAADEPKAIASLVQKYAAGIADQRKDALLFVSPPKELVVNKTSTLAVQNMVDWRRGRDSAGSVLDDNFNVDSSYVCIDGNYKYQYDKSSDKNRWVPLAGDIAGLCAFTDQVGQPWQSPAGFNRGQIRNVIKFAVDTRQAQRDSLYELGINPCVSFSGQGFVLYGDKTATLLASAFDRINVRRLFNLLKKAIGDAARYKLFELNDEFTRSSFKSEVDAYLDNIRSLGGIYDFRVVCDDTNNTAYVIDNNQFVSDIYIKPARSINYITLNFIATSTGADFNELVG